MNKKEIRICSSVGCYVESARLFKQLEAVMSAHLKAKTALIGTLCAGCCRHCGANAPRVDVDGKVLPRATSAEVLAAMAGI